MKYGSVCSGIEAASVAWHDLGWEPQWFSEIEQFPSEVLKHRFPDVPNLGDMTQLTQNPTFNEKPIDLLVGGTPCQSFSVAGLRQGLADPRGNLMLTFLSLADAKKPKWIVWENVPGVLSSNGGRDFGTFLGALGELGYGFAFRTLNAEYFGVAQRRRRVFVVGYLGDWRVAAAVLFESESLSGNPKPSRKKRQEVAPDAERGVGATGIPNVCPTIGCELAKQVNNQMVMNAEAFFHVVNPQPIGIRNDITPKFSENLNPTLTTRNNLAVAQPIAIAENTIGRQPMNGGNGDGFTEDGPMYTLNATGVHGVAQPIAYSFDALSSNSMKSSNPNSGCRTVDVAKTLDTATPEPSKNQGGIAIAQPIAFKEPCPTLTAKMQGSSGWAPYNETDHLVGQPIAVDTYNYTTNDHTTQTIRSQSDTEHIGAVLQSMAFPINTENMFEGSTSYGRTVGENNEPSFALTKAHSHAVGTNMAIRRLTPKECERLQGFPDDWTKIPYRNKPADQCPDGPRYKACGNSMAVPVMRWIGERIQKIENLLNE